MLSSVTEFLRSTVSDQVLCDPIWAVVALLGQVIFGGRFIIQWIASEQAGQSHVPPVFWWMSIVGSSIMLAYAVHLKNPILMMGFSVNTLVYMRNLHLVYGAANRARKGTHRN